MRLVGIALVKNELDIIEPFVRHNLRFLDHFIVLDNGSTDGTLDVLRALVRESDQLELVDDPEPGQRQAERTQRLARDFAVTRHGADWVVPLDADELLVPRPGLPLIPPDARGDEPLQMAWQTYVPTESDDASEPNPVRRIRHRRATEATPWYKAILPRALVLEPRVAWSPGNHEAQRDGQRMAHRDAGARLAHFPLRSPGQFLAKIAVTTLQYRSMADRRIDSGWHYREWYELLRRDPAQFLARFHDAARTYCSGSTDAKTETLVDDPVPYQGGAIRHTVLRDDTFTGWLALLHHAESLATRFGVVRDCTNKQGEIAADRVAAILKVAYDAAAENYRSSLTHRSRAANLEQQVFQLHDILHQDRARAADRERHLQASLSELRTEAEQLRDQLATFELRSKKHLCETELALRASWTWRAGRVIVGPLRRLARLARRVGQISHSVAKIV